MILKNINIKRIILSFIFILTIFQTMPVTAGEYKLSLTLAENYISHSNFFDSVVEGFNYDEDINLLFLSPELSIDFGNGFSTLMRGDIVWQHYFSGDESRGFFFRENKDKSDVGFDLSDAYFAYNTSGFHTKLGFQPIQYGNGFIFSDNTLGVLFDLSYKNLNFELSACRVFDSSPMAGITIGYQLGLFENIDLSAIWFEDHDNAFNKTINGILSDLVIQDKSHLIWTGLSVNKFLGPLYFSFTGAYEQGNVRFSRENINIKRDISAFFFDAGIETNFTDRFSMELFCFLATGDNDLSRENSLSMFLSPLPYNPRADIFFDPNFLNRDKTSMLILGGTTRMGVIAPGIKASLEPVSNLSVGITLTSLYAQDAPSGTDDWYGWEIDVGIEYSFKNKGVLFIEAGRFEHGDVYQPADGRSPDSATRLLIGFQYEFELIRNIF